MSATAVWLTIAGMFAVTSATRVFFMLGGQRGMSERLQRALRFAPAAALAAVTAPALLVDAHGIDFGFDNFRFYAALAALGWYLLRHSMTETIVAGMLVFTAMRLWPWF